MPDITPRDYMFLSDAPLTPRQRGILPPNVGIFDSPASCITVNREWVSHIIGILEVLTQRSAWLGDDETIDTAIQEIEQLIHALIVESCEPTLMDIRVSGGYLQKTFDGEVWLNVEEWQQIHTVVAETLPSTEDATATLVDGVLTLGIPRGATGATGATGAQGIQGIQGLPGNNGTPGAAGADAELPIGTIIWVAAPQAKALEPEWLVCDGRLLSISGEFESLYAWIFDTFGGDNLTTFALPNLLHRYPRGVDALDNFTSPELGETGGASTQTLTIPNLPAHAHTHTHTIPDHQHGVAKQNNSGFGASNRLAAASAAGTADSINTASGGAGVTGSDSTSVGAGEAFSTEPPYLNLVPMIRAKNTSSLNVEFQIDACTLEWRKNGGAWVELVDLSECTTPGPQGLQGDTGPAGAQGVQGEQGIPGECVECIEQPAPAGDTNPTFCGMAKSIAETISSVFNDILDTVQSIGTISASVNALADNLYPVSLLITGVSSVVQSVANISVATVQASLTQVQIDAAECLLYCMIRDNGGVFDNALLMAWRDEVFATSGTNVGIQEWVKTVNVYDFPFWNQKAYIGSLNPSNDCELCECGDEPPECISTTPKRWFPVANVNSNEEADGVISPAPTIGECDDANTEYYPYTNPVDITFTLDAPMWATSVTVGFYKTSTFLSSAEPRIGVNGEAKQVSSGFAATADECLEGMDRWKYAVSFETPKLISTVEIYVPGDDVVDGEDGQDWFVWIIEFDRCDDG